MAIASASPKKLHAAGIRGSSVVVPPEIVSEFEAKGEVHLGNWSQAEMTAAGVGVTFGNPEFPEARASYRSHR